MKMISWNVNGLRACMGKDCFMPFFEAQDADIFALQETKMQPHQLELDLPGYRQYWNSAVKKGYSGTAVFTRLEPLSVSYGMGLPEHDNEGRIITLEFERFFFVNVYTPNSQDELRRLPYRMDWEDAFANYVSGLDKQKPVILCGDLNVAHEEIDLKNPKTNRRNAGFTDEERGKLTALLARGFLDSFRALYPDRRDAYTWWSYRFSARDRNVGWRIDYFLMSERLRPQLIDSVIHAEAFGSDHCPVEIRMEGLCD
ncbi:MAG: exodeoxyribonuclease III [Clostridiales bacterium]|nr:exodeoxyribonuclease III [Clostridiales bacterium]